MGDANADKSNMAHVVRLSYSYLIRKKEVTNSEFEAIMGYDARVGNGYSKLIPYCGPDCPVANITWHQAADFCNKLSLKMGLETCYDCEGWVYRRSCSKKVGCRGVRLPTEAEWEYAARAGIAYGEIKLASGATTISCTEIDKELDEQAWYCGNKPKHPMPVGGKRPNRFGLYDMIGNVAEWTNDVYGPYVRAVQVDPCGASRGRFVVIRGGYFNSYPEHYGYSSRWRTVPWARFHALGFRPVIVWHESRCPAGRLLEPHR